MSSASEPLLSVPNPCVRELHFSGQTECLSQEPKRSAVSPLQDMTFYREPTGWISVRLEKYASGQL